MMPFCAALLALSNERDRRTFQYRLPLCLLDANFIHQAFVESPMGTPKLNDDGSIVTLDLHGATVDEAIDMTYRALRMAEDRGRSRLKLIHGSSTTGGGNGRTIKSALHDLLDRGELGHHATNVIRSQNTLVLALDLTTTTDPTPIQLRDVHP